MDYDAVVIGSGAGGGAAAYSLATSGKRILLIENGSLLTDPNLLQDEKQMLLDRIAHEQREFIINGRRNRLFIGGLVGGGTSLYGAVLMRPSREDFLPGKYYKDYLPECIHEWPVQYDELEPFYEKAEDLYRVSADHSAETPHIESRRTSYPGKSLPLKPINNQLAQSLTRQGLKPFQLPLAIDSNKCLDCPSCPGYGCPNESRSSSFNRCIKPAVENHGLDIWTNTQALKINGNSSGKASTLTVWRKDKGKSEDIAASLFIVSAGAVGSPILLLKSGLGASSGQLGRNFMYHAGVLGIGLFPRPTGAADYFIKQLGWTDFYFGTNDFPHKLGYVQALPVPGPLTLQSEAPVPIPLSVAKFIHARTVGFASTVEDLPRKENRIELSRDGQILLFHKFHEYDLFRSNFLLRRIKRILKKCGATLAIGATSDQDDLHTAHQVGTCRFGKDPRHSVLDPMCKVHGTENVFVIDGSFMPASLGVGPALTIIANALRVSEFINKEGY